MKTLSKHTLYRALYNHGNNYNYSFIDLCKSAMDSGEILTFDLSYLKDQKRVDFSTPFHEIKLASIQEIAGPNKGIFDKSKNIHSKGIEDYALLLKNAIRKYFIDNWDSKRLKLVCHSAGYDSRIMSGVLAELRDELGKDWIGDIHFRCHEPEGDMFNEIMKAQGWNKNQYSIFPIPDFDTYDIGKPESIVDGFAPYFIHMNWWRDFVPAEKEKDVVIIFGTGGGEIFDYPSQGKKYLRNINYCENSFLNGFLNYFLLNGEWETVLLKNFNKVLQPYFSYEYLKVVKDFNTDYLGRCGVELLDNIRYEILKTFDVDLINIEYRRHDHGSGYVYNLSSERKTEMLEFFINSKFYEDYGDRLGRIDFLNEKKLMSHDCYLYGFAICYEEILK